MEKKFSENSFSREYLLKKSYGHALGIKFKNASASHEKHGGNVVMLNMHDDSQEIVKNMLATPPRNTSGEITCSILDTDIMGNKTITFNTDDILEVLMHG
jgi:hypothetical protein